MNNKPNKIYNSLLLRKDNKNQYYNVEQVVQSTVLQPVFMLKEEVKERCSNFIAHNKKGLKNFFKDRIPHEKMNINSREVYFSPTKVFTMRKEQMSKQEETKIRLYKSIDIEGALEQYKASAQKINGYFKPSSQSREKTEITTKTLTKNSSVKKSLSTCANYRFPTENSIVKRSSTKKNQAYDSVFGDQLFDKIIKDEKMQREIFHCPQDTSNKTTKRKERPKTQYCKRKSLDKDRERLDQMITKMQDIYSKLNTNNNNGLEFMAKAKLRQVPNPQKSCQKTILKTIEAEQDQILYWVKTVSQKYKQKNLATQRLNTIDDIQKVDSTFYKKMLVHKKNRLQVRRQALKGINITEMCRNENRGDRNNDQTNSIMQDQKLSDNQSFISQQVLTSKRKSNKNQEPVELYSINPHINFLVQKFSRFGRALVQSLNISRLYNIQKQNIYQALWKKRKPFELQGSYVFFKLIRNDNLEIIRNFYNRNNEYIHQIDYEHRTCLIYAAQNNCVEIVEFLAQTGVNIDFQAANGATALIYAISNNNYAIVEILLKAGASPWSTKNYNLNQLLENCDKKIKIAIKNSRKLQIARSLFYSLKEKDQFWNWNKDKIRGHQLIKII